MDLRDTPEQAAYRARAREWLAANAPAGDEAAPSAGLLNEPADDAEVDAARAWQARKADAGWAGITWPAEHGGRGGTALEQVIWHQEERRVRTPPDVFFVGIGVCGPLIVRHGTPEQQARFLAPILRGEEIWCQLFSEPGAGSDLAAVRTRARRDGEDWVLDGQKVWTSFAEHARWGIALARTDPDARKSDGLTLFVVDMEADGVDVRPIRQLSGRSPFSEVFLNGVVVRDEDRIGEVDRGWRVAMGVLADERTSVGAGGYHGVGWDDLARTARRRGALADPVSRQRLASLYVRLKGIEYTGWRSLTAIARDGRPGPESSVGKLAVSLATRDACALGHALHGADGAILDDDAFWAMSWLEAPALRIVSGTDEIQRTIIGEQVLGLPPEPRLDKDLPFNRLPTGAARG
jgi:alkylation response protein AidB-like acyl-CoA dehydrogenase